MSKTTTKLSALVELNQLIAQEKWVEAAEHPQLAKFPEVEKTVRDFHYPAAIEYLNRKARASHPEGSFDNASRWYPDEYYPCCTQVRSPSRAWPYSLMVHCRTAEHVANEYGCSVKMLRRIARQIERQAEGE